MKNFPSLFKFKFLVLTAGILLVTSYLLLVTFPIAAHAACDPADWKCVVGTVNDPTGIPGQTGDQQISYFLSRIVELLFIVASIVFVFMILFSAFQWITSGGDKEALTKARGRLTHAIIGLVLLSLSFVIINILANFTGIGILDITGFEKPKTPAQQEAPAFDKNKVPAQPGTADFDPAQTPVQPAPVPFDPIQFFGDLFGGGGGGGKPTVK